MMTKEKLADLQTRGREALERAKALEQAARAEGRQFTPGEQAEHDRELKTTESLLEQIRQGKHDLAILEQTRELSAVLGGGLTDANGVPFPQSGAGPHDKTRRLSFKGMGATMAGRILGGEKALSPSGAAVVSQEFTADPVSLGKPALSLLDVIPVIQHATPEISYLRQTTRTNNAAVVNANALNPRACIR
jgi:hypothetical protein